MFYLYAFTLVDMAYFAYFCRTKATMQVKGGAILLHPFSRMPQKVGCQFVFANLKTIIQ